LLSLHVWLDTYAEDFVDPPKFPVLQRLDEFCKETVPESELAVRVKHRLERLQNGKQINCQMFDTFTS
jgi:ral guanine nucleotide dissociation stimulator-like 1